ncbi:hypothetical protein RclHR1_16260006 [Rhizophagus clarus]|uniref:Uncharacterized protein n=1 Tax=Rhizophagus clarus TaxID=94130 RepID=A0A2Z6R9Z8_9GLOM|nr:hypothetical protein RclHR1_16260006 [Rhizophagus clarus]
MMFPKIKDHCLNISMPNNTIKRKELAWGIVVSKFEDILFPLLQAVNSEQKPLLQVPDNNESIPNASNQKEDIVMADLSKIKEINTTSTSYVLPERDITIPYAMIDSRSDSSIFSENVAIHLGQKINRKKIYRLNGVANKSHSLGTVDSVLVTIEDKKNKDTISDEFSVVPTEYDDNENELSLFILGTKWQHRVGWEPLVKGEFKTHIGGFISSSKYIKFCYTMYYKS